MESEMKSNERSNCSNRVCVCVIMCSTNIALPSVQANSVNFNLNANGRFKCRLDVLIFGHRKGLFAKTSRAEWVYAFVHAVYSPTIKSEP